MLYLICGAGLVLLVTVDALLLFLACALAAAKRPRQFSIPEERFFYEPKSPIDETRKPS